MNRRDLIQHLREHDCEFLRQGGRHEMWQHKVTGKIAGVPRHRTIKKGIVRNICRALDIPLPPGL